MTAVDTPALSVHAYEAAMVAALQHGSWWDFARTCQAFARDHPAEAAVSRLGRTIVRQLEAELAAEADLTRSITD